MLIFICYVHFRLKIYNNDVHKSTCFEINKVENLYNYHL
jgi:hypothetical protein